MGGIFSVSYPVISVNSVVEKAMTGTDRTKRAELPQAPTVILVRPQMPENVGASARAMFNCGLSELRLVNPRDGWPNENGTSMAAGAFDLMPPVDVFDSTASALADCHYIYATTARPRDMVKPVFTARSAAADMHKRQSEGQKIGILFGGERSGLENDDVALAHAVITIPLNPAFSSLNLAQGVLLVAYEWSQLHDQTTDKELRTRDSQIATHAELHGLFERLEAELDTRRFFHSEGHKPIMIRNLRNMLSRAEMTGQEANTFHGIISALIGNKKGS